MCILGPPLPPPILPETQFCCVMQGVSNSDLQAKFGLIFNLGLVNSRYTRVDQTQVEN